MSLPVSTPVSPRRRIHFIDEVRGADLLLMIAYHTFYTVGYLFGVPAGVTLFRVFAGVSPFFAGLFVFICGISCCLSHNNWLRGGMLLGVAIGMSVVLWLVMPDQMIWFGILHFLGVAILLFSLLRPLLKRIPPLAGVLACAVLLCITWWLPAEQGSLFGIKGLFTLPVPPALVDNVWLYPLGLGNGSGADYFPLFPWIFCFLAGSFVGVWATREQFPRFMYKSRAPWLSWLGKHTLVIYVVHQPVVYALCWLFFTAWHIQ